MQYIKELFKERHAPKPLRACESYCLTFPHNICAVSGERFALQKKRSMLIFTDTNDMLQA